jgi:predicted aspartyl protease
MDRSRFPQGRSLRGLTLAASTWLAASSSSDVLGRLHGDDHVASATAASATVDLPASLVDGRFLLQAWNGTNGPLRLLLDTGANRTILDSRAVARMSAAGVAQPKPGAPIPVAFLGRTVPRRMFRLDSLRIGARFLEAPEVVESDLRALSRTGLPELDGIAGMDLFDDVRLVLDFRAGRVSMEPAGSPLPEEGSRLALEGAPRRPSVRIPVAGRPVALLLDTGYTGTIAVPPSSVPFSGPLARVNVSAAADRMVENLAGRVDGDFTLHQLTFQRPIADLHPNGEGMLGLEALRRFVVRIDPVARNAHFIARESGPITTPGIRSLGFAFSAVKEGLRVESVLGRDPGGSPLRRGDVIVSLAGQPAVTNGTARVAELLGSAVDSVDVVLLRGRATRNERLRIQTLLE